MCQNIFGEWREELWQSLRAEIARGMEGAEDVESRVFFLDTGCWVDTYTAKKVGELHTTLFGGDEAEARRAESEFKEVMTMIRRSGAPRFSARAWLDLDFSHLPLMHQLIQYALSLTVGTSSIERGFSTAKTPSKRNRIKAARRAQQHLLKYFLHGMDRDEVCQVRDRALSRFLADRPRRLRQRAVSAPTVVEHCDQLDQRVSGVVGDLDIPMSVRMENSIARRTKRALETLERDGWSALKLKYVDKVVRRMVRMPGLGATHAAQQFWGDRKKPRVITASDIKEIMTAAGDSDAEDEEAEEEEEDEEAEEEEEGEETEDDEETKEEETQPPSKRRRA